jgi:inorganic triphosphatase YgiF
MKPKLDQPAAPQEVELKLSLPHGEPQSLAKLLSRVPVLSRRKAAHQILHNIYYDTPGQQLRQQRAVLRLRRVGSDPSPQWLQTFKTGTSDTSALSQRGEWEYPLTNAELSRQALDTTPWSDIDADGSLFAALVPCFVTVFERTTWLVRRRDGSVVEVALDLGQIEANGKTAPICELELELKAGPTSALFDISQQIARTVAVLPANISKAQRGFLLAQGDLNRPYQAQLPRLSKDMPMLLLAPQVLRSAFAQFTSNLESLRASDDPELVHQVRVGWRRFKSAQQFFRKFIAVTAPEPSDAFRTLLGSLGELRNLDVALTATLPALADDFILGDAMRAQSWQVMTSALAHLTALQRQTVRQALQQPAAGASLLGLLQWLESPLANAPVGSGHSVSLHHWARKRVKRLNRQIDNAHQAASTPAQWHRVRILAKRLRYSTEGLRDLLPHRLAKQATQHAADMQARLGATRDRAQACTLVAKLALDPGLKEFVRGVAVGIGR